MSPSPLAKVLARQDCVALFTSESLITVGQASEDFKFVVIMLSSILHTPSRSRSYGQRRKQHNNLCSLFLSLLESSLYSAYTPFTRYLTRKNLYSYSWTEETEATMSEQRKAVIKNADMDEKMQQDAVDIASKALSEYNIEKVGWWQPSERRSNFKLSVFARIMNLLTSLFLSIMSWYMFHFRNDRTLLHISRKNLTESILRRGMIYRFETRCFVKELVQFAFDAWQTFLSLFVHQARDRWAQLWKLCDTWDQALYLFLSRTSGSASVQERIA